MTWRVKADSRLHPELIIGDFLINNIARQSISWSICYSLKPGDRQADPGTTSKTTAKATGLDSAARR